MIEKIPILGRFFGFLESEDMDYGLWVFFIGIFAVIAIFHTLDITQNVVFSWMFALAPIWLPITTFLVFFGTWMDTVGKSFYLNGGRTTIEVILPQEVYKSPEAMETVLVQIFNKATPDNLMETYLQGKRPQITSLEIVSRGGQVHFYVNAPTKKGVRFMETALYAQYPGIEIRELPVDYTAEIHHSLEKDVFMSFHMMKVKDEVYPIKTYVDCKLTDLPKEEEKVDPMVQMIESLSSLDPHEQMWVQFLISAHRDGGFKEGYLKKKDTWVKAGKAEIDKIMMRDPETKAGPVDIDGMPRVTTGERDTADGIERNISKTAFDVKIRWVYLTKEGKFGGDRIPAMLRNFASYDGSNKIAIRWRTDFNYKFISDPFGKRLKALRKTELKEYKLRKLEYKSNAYHSTVFSVEELATIWHPLGTAALSSSLQRVSSAKSQAPTNLPIGPT